MINPFVKVCRNGSKKCVYKNMQSRLSTFSTQKVDKSGLSTFKKYKWWIEV
ncbi:MAG: hypothetical protein IJ329_01115 [Clostridia bacterium]|nr:hypothetical protein [Clostridia bacterium]